MENNKYYTPEIEEFHVGFEFEYKTYKGNLLNKKALTVEWIKCNDLSNEWDYEDSSLYAVIKRKENGEIVKNRKLGISLKESTKLKISKGNSSLTDTQVREIRNLLKEKKLKGKEIALIYNVLPMTISQINKKKIYERIN